MISLITASGDDPDNERIAAFVARRCGIPGTRWANYVAIGLVRGDEILAGLVYSDYAGNDIRMHVAGRTGRKWLTRTFLWAVFDYPFNVIECERVTAVVRSDNIDSLRFCTHVGFKPEAVLSKVYEAGVDAVIMVMWKSECRWLRNSYHGKINTVSAEAA